MKVRKYIALLSLFFLVFSSCAKQQPVTAKKTNTLRMNVTREPMTMDPEKAVK